jgi:1-deoxy-D-xylulose-5-phosphate reductoisomerase
MGAKITVDSATMMNKALEVIEAHWLFGVEADRIEVVVHPQSIIHSMVRMVDGSLLAQLSVPDMKGPIAFALAYPDGRLSNVMERLDLVAAGTLTFLPVDNERFPGIERARHALRGASGAPAVLNAANEVAVDAFLTGRLGFTGINRLVAEALDRYGSTEYRTLEDVSELTGAVTTWAREQI